MTVSLTEVSTLPSCYHDGMGTWQWLHGLPYPLTSRQHPSCDSDSISNLETVHCHHAVVVNQKHLAVLFTCRMVDALSVAQPTKYQRNCVPFHNTYTSI